MTRLVFDSAPALPPAEHPSTARLGSATPEDVKDWLLELPEPLAGAAAAVESEWWQDTPAAGARGRLLVLHARPGTRTRLALAGPGAATLLPATASDVHDFTRCGWRIVRWTDIDASTAQWIVNRARPHGTALVNYRMIAGVVDRYTHATTNGPEAWLEAVVRDRIRYLRRRALLTVSPEHETREQDRECDALMAEGTARWGTGWAGMLGDPDYVDGAIETQEQLNAAITMSAQRRSRRWLVAEIHARLLDAIDRGDRAAQAQLERDHRAALNGILAAADPAERLF